MNQESQAVVSSQKMNLLSPPKNVLSQVKNALLNSYATLKSDPSSDDYFGSPTKKLTGKKSQS